MDLAHRAVRKSKRSVSDSRLYKWASSDFLVREKKRVGVKGLHVERVKATGPLPGHFLPCFFFFYSNLRCTIVRSGISWRGTEETGAKTGHSLRSLSLTLLRCSVRAWPSQMRYRLARKAAEKKQTKNSSSIADCIRSRRNNSNARFSLSLCLIRSLFLSRSFLMVSIRKGYSRHTAKLLYDLPKRRGWVGAQKKGLPALAVARDWEAALCLCRYPQPLFFFVCFSQHLHKPCTPKPYTVIKREREMSFLMPRDSNGDTFVFICSRALDREARSFRFTRAKVCRRGKISFRRVS